MLSGIGGKRSFVLFTFNKYIVMITTTAKHQLEQIIDNNSLASVIEMIYQICYEKADHILENWQDRNTASTWKQAGNRLSNVSDKVAC